MITVNINARDHEEAHVASAKFTLPEVSLSLAEAEVTKQLAVTVRWAEEKDMLIGHVKAYLTWGTEDARMLSTTGGAVEVKGSALPSVEPELAEVGITGIVFGVELEALEDRLEGMAAAIAGQNGQWCVYAHECEHHHHHDHDHGEDCDCGCHDDDHDHEHHHSHEPGEACSCHEHEHHHDHAHHGHEA